MRIYFLVLLAIMIFPVVRAPEVTAASGAENPDAIVILDEIGFHVKNINSAVLNIHRKVQVLREKGKEFGRFSVTEDKYRKCKKIKATILDMDGKKLKELKKDDILEANLSPGSTIYDDNKYKLVEMVWPRFPYILDLEYEVEYSSIFIWPDWYPQEDVPVMRSVYRLILDGPVKYQTFARGIDISPDESRDGNKQTLTWILENLEPRTREDWMPPEDRYQKYLLFSPAIFELDGYQGSSDSWATFGAWFHKLSNGRTTLTPEMQEQVRMLVAECSSDREKIQKLYAFLQEYTRYVSISLGIGGWQPHSAESVCASKYGDCKDLSAFMVAMANYAGIKAYPALVKTRDTGVVQCDFPANQFNHVIAFVPFSEDTMWLECTADYLAAGELPPDDEGSSVLAITEKGGEIVRTPSSTAGENVQSSLIMANLENDGSLRFSGTVKFTGNRASLGRGKLLTDERKDILQIFSTDYLARHLTSPTLQSCNFTNLSDNYDHPLVGEFSGTVKKYAVCSSQRIFFNPALLNRQTASDLPDEEERQFAVSYRYPYITIDTVQIVLPAGYKPEAVPEPLEIAASFGRYISTNEIADGQLTYIREIAIYHKQISPDDYQEYRSFMKQVIKNDKAKFVLNRM